jgi:hypothetical protein
MPENKSEFNPSSTIEPDKPPVNSNEIVPDIYKDSFTLDFSISILMKLLIGTTILLGILSIGLNIYYHTYNNLAYITSLFDMDTEWNIPTRYASGILVLAAFLFFVVFIVKRKTKDKFTLYWLGLAIIFFIMGLDESISLHEQTSQFFRGSVENLHFAWVIPGTIFVLAFGIIYLKFFLSLEARWKKLFFLSAFIFISGALGMELVTNFYQESAGQENLTYSLLTTFEELLEKGGIVLLIYTLLAYLKHLNLSYRINIK